MKTEINPLRILATGHKAVYLRFRDVGDLVFWWNDGGNLVSICFVSVTPDRYRSVTVFDRTDEKGNSLYFPFYHRNAVELELQKARYVWDRLIGSKWQQGDWSESKFEIGQFHRSAV